MNPALKMHSNRRGYLSCERGCEYNISFLRSENITNLGERVIRLKGDFKDGQVQ